jgi:hypothetical protein
MERYYMPKSNCAQIFMPFDVLAGFLQIGAEITLVCSKFGEQRRVHGRLKKIDYAWRQLVLDCGVVDADSIVAIE